MAVPFSNTKLRVPKGFQNILEGLAREVLRTQPENIFEFGSQYFEKVLKYREETGHDPAVHGARLEDRYYNNDSFKSPDVDVSSKEQQDAALKIQTNYRKHAAEQEVAEMREEDAAEKIQAGFRGYQDRQKFQEMKRKQSGETRSPEKQQEEEEVDIDLNDPEVEAAAVKIQAGFKGFKARQEIKDIKEEKQIKEEEEPKQEEEVDIDLEDPEVQDAALKIQAGFKGMKARQEVKSLKDSKEPEPEQKEEIKEEEEIDIDLEDPETEKAALKIQAGFKGFKTRKELKDKKDSEQTSEQTEEQTAEQTEGQTEGQTEQQTEEQTEEQTGQTEEKKEEEVDIDLNDPEVAKAATKIQAGFKGYKTRKEIKETKDSKDDGNEVQKEGESEEKTEEKTEEQTTQETTEEQKTEEKTEEQKTEEQTEEPKTEGFVMQLAPENAEKIMNALSAFKTFKKPTTLPDHLRFSRKHLQSIKRWRSMARKKLKKGTFTSLTQLACYLPLDIEEDNVKDIIDVTRVLGDDTVHTPEPVEQTPQDLDDDNFPDFFNVDTNDWDEDWGFGSDDDDIPNHGVGRIPPLENIEGFQETMKDTIESFAELVQPITEKFMTKAICYVPYKQAKDVFETWVEENRGSQVWTSAEIMREKEKHLQLYRDIVDVFENMDDDDDEAKKEIDANKVKVLMNQISAISGLLPAEVQAAQDEAAISMLENNVGLLAEPFEEIVPKMDETLGNLMKGLLITVEDESREEQEFDLDTHAQDCTIL